MSKKSQHAGPEEAPPSQGGGLGRLVASAGEVVGHPRITTISLQGLEAWTREQLLEGSEVVMVFPATENEAGAAEDGTSAVTLIGGSLNEMADLLDGLRDDRLRAQMQKVQASLLGGSADFEEARGEESTTADDRSDGEDDREQLPLDRCGVLDVVTYARQIGAHTDPPVRKIGTGGLPDLGQTKPD